MREGLKEDQLEHVTGGYVVTANGQFYVIQDSTGNILSKGPVESMATMAAKYQGQSTEMISAEEYEKIFGKAFPG